jgi:hypothetical protein
MKFLILKIKKASSFSKTTILFLIVLFVTRTNAQNYELGKVSIQELQEKACPIDTNAVASILYNKAKTFFKYDEDGFRLYHEYEFRIKVYKKEGLTWANFKVPYYVGFENLNQETVNFSDCITYNLENANIVKTKLKSEGSFKNKVNQYWAEATISLPNVKVGSVIEFKYILKSENNVNFPIFNIQYDIPVKYVEYKTQIPEFYIYKSILKGYLKIKSDSKLVNGSQSYNDRNNQLKSFTYQQINSSYIAENVAALKDEDYVDNLKNYKSSIINELETIRFPNEPVKDIALTWEGVAKNIYENKDFGKELFLRSYFEENLKAIIKNDTTQTQKATTIFKFVKNKMNWNSEFGYFSEKGVKQAYIDNTGNVAEINFILISMLNHAGISTNPVLVSTVEHGIPVFPNRTVFNYVIAAANIDGKQILLDATNKWATLDILPLNVLNWTGRLIRPNLKSEEINLVPTTLSKKMINLVATIDSKGKITGKTRVLKSDYEAFSYRQKYAQANEDNYIEKLENDLNGIQITNYKTDNKDLDLTKPVVETFSFETQNQSEIIGDKIYISPLLFFTQTKNLFVQEERKLPVSFPYPKEIRYNISIEIPEGYIVESLPKSITLTTGDYNLMSFKYYIANTGNKIQVTIASSIDKSTIPADYYDVLKDFSQKAIDKQNEKIVLKKI